MNEALKGTAVDKHPLSSWLLFKAGLGFLFVFFVFFKFSSLVLQTLPCFLVLTLLLLITSRKKIRSILYSLKLHTWPLFHFAAALNTNQRRIDRKTSNENNSGNARKQEIRFCRDITSHICLRISMFSACFVLRVYVHLCKHLQAYSFILCGDICRHISNA